jgi:hypothetical protein
MDSSDSDDDLLLSAPTFKVTKKSRAQDKNRANEIKMLTSMLKDSDREHASFTRMTQFKREVDEDDMDDDELRAQVLQVAQKQQFSSRPRRHGGNYGR